MNAPRSAVVVNPAKLDDTGRMRRTLTKALARAGWPEPQWYETTVDDPGAGQARAAVEAGAEVVFACGGDGTVMACAGALSAPTWRWPCCRPAPATCSPPTSGSPPTWPPASRSRSRAGRQRLDLGSIPGPDGGKRYFTVMAGMGFDAQMLAATSETTKSRIGWPAYVMGAHAAPARPADAGLRAHRRRAAAAPPGAVGAGRQRRPAPGRGAAAHRGRAGRRLARRRDPDAADRRSLGRAGLGGPAPAAAGCRAWRCSAAAAWWSPATGRSPASSTATSSSRAGPCDVRVRAARDLALRPAARRRTPTWPHDARGGSGAGASG